MIVPIEYDPRPLQLKIHEALDEKRFGVAVCHRRFGKTVLAVNQLIKGALTCKRERPRFAYVGPTYKQAKGVAWDYLLHYTREIPGRLVNISELRVDIKGWPTQDRDDTTQVRVFGADDPDSLRGFYLDGVVMDEHGLMPSRLWGEIIRPALSDRTGWAFFIGTPQGHNAFYELVYGDGTKWQGAKNDSDWFVYEYKASETGYVSKKELESARKDMTADQYAQEYECSWEAAIKGAIYAKELEAARAEGRVTSVPYDKALPVDTDWDLGIGDAMAIWFSQSTRGGEVRLIDYHEASGEGFPYYAKLLHEKPYAYGKHWAPHDITVRELSSGMSRLEVAAKQGIRFETTPRLSAGTGYEVEEGIHAARMLFSRCWFDAERCKAGLEALTNYRRDFNERMNEFKASPIHDWASHGADAFRGLAARYQIPEERKKQRQASMPREWSWT